jgi:hypothetical protein
MTKLFSDVWVFRLAKCLSREEISRRFFHVLWANGMAPDLCNNDHGKLVKFNRERFDSYSNEDLCLIKSRPARPPLVNKDHWHAMSLRVVSAPVLVGGRPLLYVSHFRGALQNSKTISLETLFESIAEVANYGYEVTLPIEEHAGSYATQLGRCVFFGKLNGPESFVEQGDQNELLFAKPRNIYPEMVLMKRSLDNEMFRKFLLLHQEFGGTQIDQGAYIKLQMHMGLLPTARAAMWEAGVIVSNRLTANEWFESGAGEDS